MALPNEPELSIILPCRNEALALGFCLKKIDAIIRQHRLSAEIIVSDSSTDESAAIALRFGARVLQHGLPGYGRACLAGFSAARGRYIFLADADATYDFSEIKRFLDRLRQGCDIVIGNRLAGTIAAGAMPVMHRYVGNPLLSAMVRFLFGANVSDVHCGMRALRRDIVSALNLRASGMEFASEMIIRAAQQHRLITELPINYFTRLGKSKLHPYTDGWRHVYCMFSHFFHGLRVGR